MTSKTGNNKQTYQEFRQEVKTTTDVVLPSAMPEIGKEIAIIRPNYELYPKAKQSLVFIYLGGFNGFIYGAETGAGNQTYIFNSKDDLRVNILAKKKYLSKQEKREKATKTRKFEEKNKAKLLYKKAKDLNIDDPTLIKHGLGWVKPVSKPYHVDFVPCDSGRTKLVELGELKSLDNGIIQVFWAVNENFTELELKAFRLFKNDGRIEQSTASLTAPCYHFHQKGNAPVIAITVGYKNAFTLVKNLPSSNIVELFNFEDILNFEIEKLLPLSLMDSGNRYTENEVVLYLTNEQNEVYKNTVKEPVITVVIDGVA